jgi:hypothetical protein
MQQIAAPRAPLDVIKTAADSLVLPLRRPIVLVPFLFTMGLLFALVVMVFFGIFAGGPGLPRVSSQQAAAALGSAALVIVVTMLAVEVTTDLVARAELGQDLALTDAVAHSLARFPASLATAAVFGTAVFVGSMLLIVPGLVVAARWLLAPTVVLLGGRGVRDGIGTSWQMTGAHFAALAGLLLAVTVGALILSVPLAFVPVFGQLAAAWLGFAWGAIALTLAYVRLGGPVDLG